MDAFLLKLNRLLAKLGVNMINDVCKIHCRLNELYKPLIKKSDSVKSFFESKGYKTKSMFANNHYTEHEGKFLLEYYPLRVIAVESVGDFVFSSGGYSSAG